MIRRTENPMALVIVFTLAGLSGGCDSPPMQVAANAPTPTQAPTASLSSLEQLQRHAPAPPVQRNPLDLSATQDIEEAGTEQTRVVTLPRRIHQVSLLGFRVPRGPLVRNVALRSADLLLLAPKTSPPG